MSASHATNSHPIWTLLRWGLAFHALLSPVLSQTNAQFVGSARCDISIDGAYSAGHYSYNETHTYTMTGAPTLAQGIYWRYPATWRVNGSGTKTYSVGSTSAITTFAVDHSQPIQLQVFNRASDNYLLVNQYGNLPQQTVVVVRTVVTENGVQRLEEWLGNVWEYQFPTIVAPPATTAISGSSTTGWLVPPRFGVQQPDGVPSKVDCQWQFTATPVPCNYSLSSTSYQAPAAGGSSSVALTTSSATCPWTGTSNASFLSITAGASGAGSGTITFQVQPNPNPQPRSGTISIAGLTFTVEQAAGALVCTYNISPNTYQATSAGGNTSFAVTPNDASCPWSASSNSPFLSIAAGSFGIGQQNVSLVVQPNTSTQARSGTITVATQTFTVNQAGAASPS